MKTRRKNVAVAVLAAILAVALSVALFAFVPTARASETVGESAAPLPAEAPEGTIAIIEATVLDSGEQPAVTYCDSFETLQQTFTQPLEENYLAANAAQSESGVVVPAEQTNAVASVTASDGSVTYYDVLHDAFLAAKEGETIDILRNVTDAEGRTGALESIGVWLYIQDKSVTINGNGCTLTASDCGWGLYIVNSTGKDYSVTISDLTIVSTGNGLWPMEVCNGHYTVTLDNVTLDNSGIQTASSSAAFTVGGSGENTVVTVQNGSVLNAGERGYAIRVLNPVDLTVDNSTLKGRTALYMQGRFSSVGSAGSVVVIENGSVLETVAPGSLSSGSEEFGTLVFEMGGVDVTIRDSEVSASSEEGAQAQGVVFYSDFYVGAGNPIEDVTVRFENTDIRLDGVRLTYGAGDDSAAGGSTPTAEAVTVAGGSVNVLIEQKYMAAGYVFAAENGGYSVVSEEYAAANFDAYIAGQDGEIYYPSLQEAIAAVKDGDVITVLDDITFTSYLSIFKIDGVESFTLDLNKHTITLAHGGAPFALQVSGYNYNDANDPTGFAFIVKNGTIKGDAGSAKNAAELIYITNQARLIAEDLVIEYSAPNSSAMAVSLGGIYKDISTDPVTEYPHRLTNVTVNSMQAGGVQVTSGEAIFENCTFNIEKGDATGNAWVYSSVAVSHSGTAVVESGTYTSDTYGAYIFSSGGNFVINGGSFSAGENYAVLKSDRDDTATFLTIVIHDGSFSGPINVENSTEMTLYGGKYSTQLNTAWLAPDCAQMEGDGSFTVGKVEYLVAEQNVVAMVEETGVAYTSLQAAFDAVDGEATVILLNDIIFGENENFTKYNLESGYGSDFGYYYSIDENQNIVLDLNGKKIDASGYSGENHQNGDWLFENKGTFTIKNGTILAFKDVEYYVNGVQGLVYSVPGASVTVESGEFSCIVGFANSEDSVVNIEGGEFNFSNIFPIAVLVGTNQGKGGTVNIGKQGAAGPILNLPYENESVQSLAVLIQNGSDITFNIYSGKGLSIINTAQSGNINVNIEGGEFVGMSFFDNASISMGYGNLNISGGNFAGSIQDDNANVKINGGTYSEPVPVEYLATDMVQMADENGIYTVGAPAEMDAVAVIEKTGVAYASLQEAIGAAASGETVKLLQDITLSGNGVVVSDMKAYFSIEGTQTLTLDLNGHSISYDSRDIGGSNASALFINMGNFTVCDSVGTGEITNLNDNAADTAGAVFYNLGGTLTIEGGTYNALMNLLQFAGTVTVRGDVVFKSEIEGYTGGDDGIGALLNSGEFFVAEKDGKAPVFDNVLIAYGPVKLDIEGGEFNGSKGASALVGSDAVVAVAFGNGGSTLTVSGGTFNAGIGEAGESDTVAVSGGMFSEPVPADYLSGEAGLVVDADGNYIVVTQDSADYMVTLTADGYRYFYETLVEAVDAVPTDGTDALIEFIGTGKVYRGAGFVVNKQAGDVQNITIDFNGNTYDVIGPTVGSAGTETNGFQLKKGSTVIMKNGTITVSDKNAQIFIQKYCDLELIDMTIDVSNNPSVKYVVSNNNATTTFKGKTNIIVNNDEQFAFDVCKWSDSAYGNVTVVIDSSFTGRIEGLVEYSTYGAAPADWAEKLNVTFAEGNEGTFDIAFRVGCDAESAQIEIHDGTFTKPVDYRFFAEGVAAVWDESANAYVAQSGDYVAAVAVGDAEIGYITLQAAIDAAEAGDTVRLMKSITVSQGLFLQKDLVVDLGGNTVNSTGQTAFTVLGDYDLTIQNGKIDVDSSQTHVFGVSNTYTNSSLTLKDVDIDVSALSSQYAYAVYSKGNVVIENGNYTVENGPDGLLSAGVVVQAGKLDISGVTIGSNDSKINAGIIVEKSPEGTSTANVSGVSVYADSVALQIGTNSSAEITGGTYFAPYAIYAYGEGAVANVSNGTFDGLVAADDGATASISGGSFSEMPPFNYFEEGYVATWDEASQAYVTEEGNWAVSINDETAFTTLAEALAAAKDGDTITLLSDLTESIDIKENQNVILDLNGHKLSNAAGKDTIVNHGTLTIVDSGEGGTVTNNTFGKAVVLNASGATAYLQGGTYLRADTYAGNSYYVISNEGIMEIDGITVKNERAGDGSSAINNNADCKEEGAAQLTIKNATIVSQASNAVKNDEYGIMRVEGGSFTTKIGTHAALQNWGTATLTGGTYTGVNYVLTAAAYNGQTGKTEISGGTFTATSGTGTAVYLYDYEGRSIVDLTITGGEFNGTYGVRTARQDTSDDSLQVKGGTFNGEIAMGDMTGFISGGQFALQPADDYFGETYAPQYYNGYFVVVKSTALTEAKYAAQADIRLYAVQLGIDWAALASDEGEGTAQAAAALLEAYDAIMGATSTLGVAEAKAVAIEAADAYSKAVAAAFVQYKADALTGLEEALAGAEGAEDDVVLPTATWFALNNAQTKAEFDEYLVNALMEVEDIRSYRAEISAQAQQLAALASTLAMFESNMGGEFDQLLTDVQGAISAAQAAIVGEDGSDTLASIQQYLQSTIKEAIDEVTRTLTDMGSNVQSIQGMLETFDVSGELAQDFAAVSSAIEAAKDAVNGHTDTQLDAAVEELQSAVSAAQTAIVGSIPDYTEKLDLLGGYVDELEGLLKGENGLAEIKKQIDGVITALGTATDGDSLFGLLEAIESGNAAIQSAITSMQSSLSGTLSGMQGDLTQALEALGSLTGALAEDTGWVAQDISAAKTEIDKIVAAIGSLGSGDDLLTQVGNIVESIEQVQGTVGSIAEKVDASTAVETAKEGALTDIESWLNGYLDELLGTVAQAQNDTMVTFAFRVETTSGDIYAKLAQAFSEDNAKLVLKYYNDALAAIDSATTVSEVTTAVSTFKAQVASVEAAAKNATNVDLTGVYVLLAVLLVAVAAAIVLLALRKKQQPAEQTASPVEKAEEQPAAPVERAEAADQKNEIAASEPVNEPAADDDKEHVVIAANVRTFAEAYVDLSDESRELFNKVREYALAKDDATEVKQSTGVCIKRNGKQIVKLTVRRNAPVALYFLENEMLKDFRRERNSKSKLKVHATELILREEEDLEAAYRMVDLSIEQIDKDIEAKKARIREMRRLRKQQKAEQEKKEDTRS